MAARNAVRILATGSPVLPKRLAAVWVSSGARTAPLTASVFRQHFLPSSSTFSPFRQFSSSFTHTTSRSSCSQRSCGFLLSRPRRAGHHALQHHEAQQIIPHYTDDIPAEYYQYGAFKNFRNDSSIVPNLVRSGAAFGITLALCLLNDVWSCEHWHYKHRLAGSYLESD